jgi:hypothetical protein
MRTTLVIVGYPFPKNSPQMSFVQGNHKIKAFSPDCAYKSFAIGICCRRSHRRFQDLQSHGFNGQIQVWAINAVPIVDQKTYLIVWWPSFPELLQCPFRRRMICDIKMKNPPVADFHDYEHIQNLEVCGYRDKKITGSKGFGLIFDEGRSSFRGKPIPSPGVMRNIFPHRTRRYSNADFQEKLGSNALFPPG